MMSERQFAEAFTSFWGDLCPRAEAYMRRRNLSLIRYVEPLDSNVAAELRGLINEAGFRFFSARSRSQSVRRKAARELELVIEQAEMFIRRVRGAVLEIDWRLEAESVRNEAIMIAERLETFFASKPGRVVCEPSFPGCGLLASCEGDVFSGDVLYEVKAGDRRFRIVDLRQVMVYAALNSIEGRYNVRSIGLLNPRRGVFFVDSVQSVARAIAGMDAGSLFWEICDFLSRETASA